MHRRPKPHHRRPAAAAERATLAVAAVLPATLLTAVLTLAGTR